MGYAWLLLAAVAAATATASVQSNEASGVEDDDTLSYFSKLAEDE